MARDPSDGEGLAGVDLVNLAAKLNLQSGRLGGDLGLIDLFGGVFGGCSHHDSLTYCDPTVASFPFDESGALG